MVIYYDNIYIYTRIYILSYIHGNLLGMELIWQFTMINYYNWI